MEVTALGINGPFPAANGATSGYLVTAGERRVQFDLGSGTLGALTALTAPEKLDALVFSHWHFDHCSDALPLIFRLEAALPVSDEPLRVYGPVDEASPVRAALRRCARVRLRDIAPGDVIDLHGLTLTIGAARHPVPSVMFRLTDGERTFCYTGDTNTLPGLADFVRDADLLLADGLFPEQLWTENKPHLSAALAGKLAADANVGRLVVTHLNPTIAPEVLLREARAAFPRAELARRGAVYAL